MRYEVRGVEQVRGALSKLRTTQIKAAIRKGSRAGAKVVASAARGTVPVRTGALRREIKVRALPRSRTRTGAQVTTRVKDGPVYYGGFVELGTKKMRARKYLKAALEQVHQAAGGVFLDTMAAEIDRVAGN